MKNKVFDQKNYWAPIDTYLSELKTNGYVKLPSLNHFNTNEIANSINSEMNDKTFMESGNSHMLFLQDLGIEEYLTPKLFNLAQEIHGYKGSMDNQYHIARRVVPGNSKEMYRAHFDSHLFTMVLPIKIPNAPYEDPVGDLLYFPKARQAPKSEIGNIVGKALFKRFANKKGMEKLALKQELRVDNFKDYRPLLFLGNTTLHTNRQVSQRCSSYRLTLLAHFFDPSPVYGIGSILRFLRGR